MSKTEQFVDEFIAETWGECEPEPYRAAMISFWDAHLAATRRDAIEECARIAAAERGHWLHSGDILERQVADNIKRNILALLDESKSGGVEHE